MQRILPILAVSLAAGLAPIVLTSGQIHSGSAATREERQAALARVRFWGCQYQKVDFQRIAASELDLIVVDPVREDGSRRPLSPAQVDKLRRRPDGSSRLVLGYLSVGEAESYRSYWNAAWKPGSPSWLGKENPNWPGSFNVRYWSPEWQALVIENPSSGLAAIVAAGFDGVFLDRIDAYDDWPARARRHEEMIAFIERLGAKARSTNPGFILIGQNAEPLLQFETYRAAIDAVSKESFLTGLSGQNVENAPSDVAWSMRGINKARASGLPVFAIEYMSDQRLMEKTNGRLKELGIIPFYGTLALDRIPAIMPFQRF